MAPADSAQESHAFQAEVGKLLDIVANALYSEKHLFLRELISNASDACDRLRYAAITQPDLAAEDPDFAITLSVDKSPRHLTIADNGIGMSHDDLVADLGTIARSGTDAFMRQLSGDATKDVALIGQFGVGFYAAFMVADRVEVTSRKAGETAGWRWSSDGKNGFEIAPAEDVARGTTITLHLKKGEDEFLDPDRLRAIVTTYSDHIAVPVRFADADKTEMMNTASAPWTRPKSELTGDQYKEFYHHVSHGLDEPWLTLHFRAEGKIEYSVLAFVPSVAPLDLFQPDRKPRLKLYVRRVFITEDCPELVPPYLRFLCGVVDSEDLSLNVSREMLQNDPLLARIRAGLTKRVLGEIKKKAAKDAAGYAVFWNNFGAVLKEGLYEDASQRETLLELCRFRSTAGDDLVSLADYVGRMKDGQSEIYFISGDNLESLRISPQLEGFRAKGVEVLLLTDAIDDFWVPEIGEYAGKKFTSATRAGVELGAISGAAADDTDAEKTAEDESPHNIDALIALLKLSLGDAVADIRASDRLTDSAVCLTAGEGGLDMHLERMLKQHGQIEGLSRRVLEINPRHEMIRRLADRAGETGAQDRLGDVAFLLLDQARILEGEPPADVGAFARRLTEVIARSVPESAPENAPESTPENAKD